MQSFFLALVPPPIFKCLTFILALLPSCEAMTLSEICLIRNCDTRACFLSYKIIIYVYYLKCIITKL